MLYFPSSLDAFEADLGCVCVVVSILMFDYDKKI